MVAPSTKALLKQSLRNIAQLLHAKLASDVDTAFRGTEHAVPFALYQHGEVGEIQVIYGMVADIMCPSSLMFLLLTGPVFLPSQRVKSRVPVIPLGLVKDLYYQLSETYLKLIKQRVNNQVTALFVCIEPAESQIRMSNPSATQAFPSTATAQYL